MSNIFRRLEGWKPPPKTSIHLDMVPAYCHGQGLGGGGTRTKDFRLEAKRLENIQEGVTR